jgi:hypothetical protein
MLEFSYTHWVRWDTADAAPVPDPAWTVVIAFYDKAYADHPDDPGHALDLHSPDTVTNLAVPCW